MAVSDGLSQVHTECHSERMAIALLSTVSHDLRGPLAAAKAAVESLNSTDVRFSHEERGELVDAAEQSLNRLVRLVENLLDANRLRVGALAISPHSVSLAEVIGRSMDELGRAGRGIRVQVPDALPEVYADAVLLERALVNLLSNALRHGRGDQPPSITAEKHRGRVEVRVVDHGPGVRPTDWERIFLPFQRLGEQANPAGVGPGLTLCRDLVEAMGGTITPEVTPGGGLTIRLGLPTSPVCVEGWSC
jgi:two-component system, OmpR family, sensor histidine kinase KdpD